MGTEYYLVDHAGRNVLDLHKCYWLSPDTLDAYVVTPAGAVACAAESPDAPDSREWLLPLMLRWMSEVAGGRPCELRSEHSYEHDPWWRPDDSYTDGGLAEGWRYWTPWGRGEPAPWETRWPPEETT